MKNNITSILFTFLIILSPGLLHAEEEELSLFNIKGSNLLDAISDSSDGEDATNVYRLKGTTRFGKKFNVYLESVSGEITMTSWQEGLEEPVYIDGTEIAITNVASREVKLLYPESDPCKVTDVARGILCSGLGREATLILSLNDAIARPVEEEIIEESTEEPVPDAEQEGQQEELPPQEPVSLGELKPGDKIQLGKTYKKETDPEKLAYIEEQRKQRVDRMKKSGWKPEKIDPADVPPGMKLVKTPFGDRLIPVKKD